MKKKLMTVLALVLVIAMSVAGTYAYLTSADKVVNTFTVGDCDELAAQIALVAGDPQRTQARASLGAAYMRQNFRLSSQIQKLSNLYRFLQ